MATGFHGLVWVDAKMENRCQTTCFSIGMTIVQLLHIQCLIASAPASLSIWTTMCMNNPEKCTIHGFVLQVKAGRPFPNFLRRNSHIYSGIPYTYNCILHTITKLPTVTVHTCTYTCSSMQCHTHVAWAVFTVHSCLGVAAAALFLLLLLHQSSPNTVPQVAMTICGQQMIIT